MWEEREEEGRSRGLLKDEKYAVSSLKKTRKMRQQSGVDENEGDRK